MTQAASLMGTSQSSQAAGSAAEANHSSCSDEGNDGCVILFHSPSFPHSLITHSYFTVCRTSSEVTIMTFLNDANCKPYFHNFLKAEFADENLKLYDEIESIKSIKNKAVLQKKLKDVYELYVKPGAEFECNIPDSQRVALNSFISDSDIGLNQPLLRLLESMEKEVLQILSLGSFPRFLKSQLYHQYVLDHRKEHRGSSANSRVTMTTVK